MRLITVHGRTRCQFYKGRADWAAIRARQGAASRSRWSSMATFVALDDALAALAASGADAVMIGRGAQGRPWLPGAIARYVRQRPARAAAVAAQLSSRLIATLYEEMLAHYGADVGRRHARKHLGWTLEAAAETAARRDSSCKAHRQRVLTEDDPARVRCHSGRAFDALADPERRAA